MAPRPDPHFRALCSEPRLPKVAVHPPLPQRASTRRAPRWAQAQQPPACPVSLEHTWLPGLPGSGSRAVGLGRQGGAVSPPQGLPAVTRSAPVHPPWPPQSDPQRSGNFQPPPLINGCSGALSSGPSWINRPSPDRPEEGREEAGGAARKPGRGQTGKTRCRARGLCQGQCPGTTPADSPGWRAAPHPTLPCSGSRASRGGVGGPASTSPPLGPQPQSCILHSAITPWPPRASGTVAIQPRVAHDSCKPQPLPGSLYCRQPGEPGLSPHFRDEPTEDLRGHSHARGSQLGSSRTTPGAPGGYGLSASDSAPLTRTLMPPRRPGIMLPRAPGGRSSAGPRPAHPPPLPPQVLPEPSS